MPEARVTVAPSPSRSPCPAPTPTPAPPSSTPNLLDQALMSANIIPQSSQMSDLQSQPATVPVTAVTQPQLLQQQQQQQQQQRRQQEIATKQIALRSVTDKPLSAATTPK